MPSPRDVVKLPGRVAKKVKRALTGKMTASHRQASSLLEKGRKFYNQKNYLKAEEMFSRAIQADPRYALAYYYQGLVRYKLDKFKPAIHAWEQAIEAEPNSDAARKAQRKIEHVGKKVTGSVEHMLRRQ